MLDLPTINYGSSPSYRNNSDKEYTMHKGHVHVRKLP